MRLAFRFRLIPFIVTVALVALGIALGNWQERRAAQKIAIQTSMAERGAAPALVLDEHPAPLSELQYRRVRLTGEFVPDWPVFLDNRPYQGRPGFYLVTPFKIAGSDTCVLVMRGWAPRDAAVHDKLPPYRTPEGQVTIEGMVTASAGRVLQLGQPAPLAPRAIVQNLEVDAFARLSGLTLLPFFVEQSGASEDMLVRDWPSPALGVEKHKGYAFQWYALAVMAAAFFVITGFRSGTTRKD